MTFKIPDYRMDINGEERMEIFERLKRKSIIDEKTGCYLLLLHQDKDGYCQIAFRRRRFQGHRASAWVYFCTIIDDKDILICHKHDICPNRNCWNPEHIYEGNSWSNTMDFRDKILFCPHSHPLEGVRGNGHRYCLVCAREHAADYRKRMG